VAIYSNIFVVLNGKLLAESVSVETSLEMPSEPVFSIRNNFEGVSVGPLVRQVSVRNVIPLSGSELQFEEMMRTNEKVELMLQEGATGRVCVSRGNITAVSRSGGVGTASSVSFTFVGSGMTFQNPGFTPVFFRA
jgi:hypothetical protein